MTLRIARANLEQITDGSLSQISKEHEQAVKSLGGWPRFTVQACWVAHNCLYRQWFWGSKMCLQRKHLAFQQSVQPWYDIAPVTLVLFLLAQWLVRVTGAVVRARACMCVHALPSRIGEQNSPMSGHPSVPHGADQSNYQRPGKQNEVVLTRACAAGHMSVAAARARM